MHAHVTVRLGKFMGARFNQRLAVGFQVHKAKRLCGASFHASGVRFAVPGAPLCAEIALFGYPAICAGILVDRFIGTNGDRAKGANHRTLLTADAILFADENLTVRLAASSGGTDKGAWRVFTLSTLHGESNAIDSNNAVARVQRGGGGDSGQQVHPVSVRHRACQLATVAAQTLLRIRVDNYVLLD
jgi:hypothetical protein